MNLIVAGLSLGIAAAASGFALEHRTEIAHRSGAVAAHYRAHVDVAHRQVGAVTPGGVSSTLRCHWTANVSVRREARHQAGSTLSRVIENARAIEGSRPGWCGTHARAIRQEIARRSDEIRGHLLAVAEQDHPVLTAEIDRLHGESRAG